MFKLRRKLRREEGASLVEFALICPILFLILFGLIDFGFIYNDFLSVRQGVRDGARQGSVANFGAATSCSGFNSAVTSASVEASELICSTRNRIGLDTSRMRVGVCLAATSNTQTFADAGHKCSADTPTGQNRTDYADGNTVVVCAMYPSYSRSGFLNPFLSGGVVTTRVAIRIEQTSYELAGFSAARNQDDFTSGFEDIAGTSTFPSGKSWNFCTP